MTTIQDICSFMETLAPLQLAEDWDNVGLLVGDASRQVNKVMACLTITPASCAEAIAEQADLIIAHHPMPFRPLKRLTTETIVGQILLDLISAKVAVYSPHTCFDSAAAGINYQIATGLGLESIDVLKPSDQEGQPGSGRFGTLPDSVTALDFCDKVKRFFKLEHLQVVGNLETTISKVGIACGSAGTFLDLAIEKKCDAFVTGETGFHTCLQAEASETFLVLPGHFATERFAVETLSEKVQQAFPGISVWASKREADPLKTL